MRQLLLLSIVFVPLPQAVASAREPNVVLILTDDQGYGEVIPYNQQHVRAGVEANGFWDLDVAVPGKYEITLRRWPEELDLPIGALLPAEDLDPQRHDVNQKLYGLPSRTIRPTSVRLMVGQFDEAVPVKAGVKCVSFRVTLPAGPVRLQTWLTDASGRSWGAYYVYIEREPS